ncbi:hypothetical protein BJ322DRAFT_1021512 [Thelephora terrestris]|uniref:Uncharacterized protein n=1 Tax=Thelephora terrestris TaxID=56493 RepID=A0A9P6HEN6_9AGAM|nr:hypothetical protein BJ322DRAFT_1021512 [Thelephora terrestris]
MSDRGQSPLEKTSWTFLEFQVGQPFQEFLVGLGLLWMSPLQSLPGIPGWPTLPGIPGWPTLPGIPGWAGVVAKVGQPFQEFLVGLGLLWMSPLQSLPGIPGWPTLPGIPGWAGVVAKVGQPFQEFLVGLGLLWMSPLQSLPGIPGWPTLPGIPGWAGVVAKVGQPFQEFLVGLGKPIHAIPTRRSEKTVLEFQVAAWAHDMPIGTSGLHPLAGNGSFRSTGVPENLRRGVNLSVLKHVGLSANNQLRSIPTNPMYP